MLRVFRNRIGLLLVAGAAVLGVSACGSGNSNSNSDGGGGASTSAASSSSTSSNAPKGAAITVGMVCSCSKPFPGSLGKIADVSTAWAKSVNDAGGINGHPVKMITYDDGGDPAKSLQSVRKLVEQDKVMALVGHFSLAESGWAKYIDQKGVPVIGGNPTLPEYLGDPNWFAVGAGLPQMLIGQMEQIKARGKKHFGMLYCSETPACAQAGALAKLAAQLVGGIQVETGKVAATSPNYTAPCLQMKSKGVDALMVAQTAPTVLKVHASCAQQGYKPLVSNETPTLGYGWLKDPNVQGALLASPNASYADTSLAQVKAFHAALDKYVPGLTTSDQFAWDTFVPWVAGAAFEAAAKAGHITPTSTPADVKAGLYKFKNETLGGVTPPMTFAKGKPGFLGCWFTMGVDGGKFTLPDGSAAKCLTPAQGQALGKALAAAG